MGNSVRVGCQCPKDIKNTKPGVCRCSMDDNDMDIDDAMDCQDECANDKDKTIAGVCSCNKADTNTD